MNSLVTGLARHGAQIAPGTLAGACAQAGALLALLEEAITERSRGSWHLHADETTWRVFAPRDGNGPAKWWLWVFLGADTACFVMDATRSGAVLARHAGIDEETGQLTADEDKGPRQLVISSDFYAVYQSAGKKADGLVNLYCLGSHPEILRPGRGREPRPAGALDRRVAGPDQGPVRRARAAHDRVAGGRGTRAAGRRRRGRPAGGRRHRMGRRARRHRHRPQEAGAGPGLQEPAKKALATLDREWDGLDAHRQYPMVSLDNNAAERALRRPVVTRKNAYGSRNEDAARLRRPHLDRHRHRRDGWPLEARHFRGQ